MRLYWWIIGTLLGVLIPGITGTNNSVVTEGDGKASTSALITDLVDFILGYSSSQGRTFGMKRIQFMLMPLMYKMGIMTTMMIVLTVLSLKGLMIGVTLLILKLSSFLAKFYATTSPHQQSWLSPGHPVHLHVHGGHYQPQFTPHYEPTPWEQDSHHPVDDHYYYKG